MSDIRLYESLRTTMMRSLAIVVQTLIFAKERGVRRRFHGRKKHESAHYCGMCEEEVFNCLFVKENEKKHVVHCLRCARAMDSQLKGFVLLEEYHLHDLLETYDNFQFYGVS